MTDAERGPGPCGVRGPGNLACTRNAGHDGTHSTYTHIDDERTAVQWSRCNALGEPTKEDDRDD